MVAELYLDGALFDVPAALRRMVERVGAGQPAAGHVLTETYSLIGEAAVAVYR